MNDNGGSKKGGIVFKLFLKKFKIKQNEHYDI